MTVTLPLEELQFSPNPHKKVAPSLAKIYRDLRKKLMYQNTNFNTNWSKRHLDKYETKYVNFNFCFLVFTCMFLHEQKYGERCIKVNNMHTFTLLFSKWKYSPWVRRRSWPTYNPSLPPPDKLLGSFVEGISWYTGWQNYSEVFLIH